MAIGTHAHSRPQVGAHRYEPSLKILEKHLVLCIAPVSTWILLLCSIFWSDLAFVNKGQIRPKGEYCCSGAVQSSLARLDSIQKHLCEFFTWWTIFFLPTLFIQSKHHKPHATLKAIPIANVFSLSPVLTFRDKTYQAT